MLRSFFLMLPNIFSLITAATVTLNDLPRVWGACCLNGVDPELVGEVFETLQGFLVGFVVAAHACLVFGDLCRLKKWIFVWRLLPGVASGTLRHAVASYRLKVQPRRRTAIEEGDLCLIQQPLPPNPIIGGTVSAVQVTQEKPLCTNHFHLIESRDL